MAADQEAEGAVPLFEHVVYTILPNVSDALALQLKDVLQLGGGQYVPLRDPDYHVTDIETLTHIISTDIEFPQYSRALELGIGVVKPSWVAASVSKKKQTSTRQYNPDPAQFMQDVVVTCAGLPRGDEEAIFAGVLALGGQYCHPLSKNVTHIVTTDFDEEKCVIAEQRSLPAKIVLPHWFHDCFSLGKKISERPYTLPNPEVMHPDANKSSVRPVHFPQQLEGATTPSPTELPSRSDLPSPSASRKGLNAFMSKKVFLASDLELTEEFITKIRELVEHGGGLITQTLKETDIYIGRFRQGADYVAASQLGKEVANLSWLYHVINCNKYVSPLRKLFHYPLPPDGIEGFQDMKISLSNYAGEARTYIENLIKYCGADYTKTMKQDNTHLVTAHTHGEKCEAAQEWNVSVVNHLWLEESYAKCAIQAVSNPKYQAFPVRTNLGEVTGQTSLDMKSVERMYFPKPRSPKKRPEQKSSAKKTGPTFSGIAAASSNAPGGELDQPMTIEAEDIGEDDENEAPATAKRLRGRSFKSSMATPLVSGGKENQSPMLGSTGGRASKMKALDTLQTQAVDVALYEKEKKRKGGVTHGGRRSSHANDSSPAPQRTSRKRPSDEYDATAQGSDLSDGETQTAAAKTAKKAKHGPPAALPPLEWRMMVTGDDRWADNPKKESNDKTTLRGMGVLLTQDPKDVDILVAPKILRTRKFVSALACAPLVVDTTYLDNALSKKRLPENPPMLKDRDNEDRLGFTLQEAIKRAKQNNRKLFRGWDIFVMREINGGFETYKDIIQLNGGEAMLYHGRSGVFASKRQNAAVGDEDHVVYLVSGKSDTEIKMWKKFREEMEKQNLEARIVSSDWLLNAAMSQEITMDDKWLLGENEALSQRKG